MECRRYRLDSPFGEMDTPWVLYSSSVLCFRLRKAIRLSASEETIASRTSGGNCLGRPTLEYLVQTPWALKFSQARCTTHPETPHSRATLPYERLANEYIRQMNTFNRKLLNSNKSVKIQIQRERLTVAARNRSRSRSRELQRPAWTIHWSCSRFCEWPWAWVDVSGMYSFALGSKELSAAVLKLLELSNLSSCTKSLCSLSNYNCF